MSISQEEDATQKAHAPLVKTALDANTATKKAELAAYAGDKNFGGKNLNKIIYFFIVKHFYFLSTYLYHLKISHLFLKKIIH